MTIKTSPARRIRLTKFLAAALAASLLFTAAMGAADARADAIERSNYVSAGGYRTLVKLWNTSRSAQFVCPAGAKIRVIYGYGWLSKTRQTQTLDCSTPKRLTVGSAWSKMGARMQIKVPESGYVTWWYIVEGP